MKNERQHFEDFVKFSDPDSKYTKRRTCFQSLKINMKKYQRFIILVTAILSLSFFFIYYQKYQNLHNVLSVLHNFAYEGKMRNSSTLHNSDDEEEHRRMFPWYWMRMSEKIHVFSAYYDNVRPSGHQIKIFGIYSHGKNEKNVKIKCLIWYAGYKKPDETTAEITLLQVSKVKSHLSSSRGALFTCDAVKGNNHVPYGVTVIDESSVTEPVKQYVYSNRILRVLPTKRSQSKVKEISVCILPPLSGPYDDLQEMIQFMEMYKLSGFKHFLFYDMSSSDRIQHLLREHAKDSGFSVEIMHWNFPLEEFSVENQILIATNDCIYRNMYHSEYVIISELHEIFVPRMNLGVKEIVNRSVRSDRNHKVLTISKAFFCDEFPDDSNKHYIPIKFKVLVKTKRHPSMHFSPLKGKHLLPVNSIQLIPAFNDYISVVDEKVLDKKQILSSDCAINIYASCKNIIIGNKNMRQIQYVDDENAVKYKNKLLSSKLLSKIHYQF
ncbi:Uncharacterised protein g7182 [Pycnogonum litorale]